MKAFSDIGQYILLMRSLLVRPDNLYMFWKETLRQMSSIGVGSLIIIGIISLFVGAVSAIQFAYQMSNSFMPSYLLGYIIRDLMIIELAPTLSCLVLAGKVGSNIAGELGSMRVSEQIDALEVMGINSRSYLLMPKVLASLIIVPPLIVLSAFLGIYGGLWAAENYGISPVLFRKGLMYDFEQYNIVIMLVKSFVFAFIITSVACFQGYNVQGGAIDIGRASTRSVVIGSIFGHFV